MNARRAARWVVAVANGLVVVAAMAIVASCPARQEPSSDASPFLAAREAMVREQIAARGIQDPRVLAAMRNVPREEFVPANLRLRAHEDRPWPIGEAQTISQPYIVAFMTEAIEPKPDQRVLEIGTGSGYQAAILAELVAEVFTIELEPTLAQSAKERLDRLGWRNIRTRQGDGYLGWPEEAPFDAIVVTCGADHVPAPLVEQLKPGGRLVIPVGPLDDQWLRIVEKSSSGEVRSRELFPVRFVPLRRAEDDGR